MHKLNDVWVNFFEGEENGYNVCEFHEWRKSDSAELMDTMPLLKVTPELFDYIENGMAEIPQPLLDAVKNKGIARRGIETIKLPYAFVISDGIGVLAVDTLSYKIPMRKSKLIPRQYQLVLELIADRKVDFELPSDLKLDKYYHILSPHPNLMVGLTRRERQLKQLLLMGLDSVFGEENLAKMKYLYVEWNVTNYADISKWDLEGLFKQFIKEVSIGWTEKHHELTKLITYDQPFYRKLYEMETA